MHWWVILLIVLAVVAGILVALYIVGSKLSKKNEAVQSELRANAQSVSILVIDKKRVKLKDAGFPQVVLDQTPKYARRAKVPVVKAKIGPQVRSLMCDEKVFDYIPVKKEVKAMISGIYIVDVRGLRAALQKDEKPKKKLFGKKSG